MGSIPKDIVDDILLRLPVKSLLRFSCVSHAWKNTLSTPLFAKLHLKLSKIRKVVLKSPGAGYAYICDDTKAESIRRLGQDYVDMIVGSCDGLLLLIAHMPYQICLCNPSTRQYKQLPRPDIHCGHWTSYGFGSNDNKEKLKVLLMKYRSTYNSEVLLYTMGSESWVRMSNIPYSIVSNGSNMILVNAKLHYLSYRSSSMEDRVILSFDITDEEFGEIPLPDLGGSGQGTSSVAELNGNLCVVWSSDDYSRSRYIWLMKEYGVKESWTNMFFINMDVLGTYHSYLCPLHFSENQILLKVQCFDYVRIVAYDYRNHSASSLELIGLPKKFDALNFVETLISPNSFNA